MNSLERARQDADGTCVCRQISARYLPDIYQIALVSICTNTIYQIVILELTPNGKKVVVNGPP